MILNKTTLIAFIVGAVLGLACGFFSAKAMYDRPLETSVKTDTLIVHDTIPDYNPSAKDSALVKTKIKWFPVYRTDTVDNDVITYLHDTVAVAVPITSKHYQGNNYDAYVSGFEPNLDSIKVYSETQYITTTITKMKPPNKWELDIVSGVNYNTAQDRYTPFVCGELMYKPSRLQFGLQGGVIKADKIEPVVEFKAKIRVF